MSKQSESITATALAAAAFGAAASAVDEAAAAAFGVNRTDLRMIGILNRDGNCTAGQLSAACGLSPAATTTAIGRLVDAGHAVRRTDPHDGRRVVVALTEPAERLLVEIYRPVGLGGTAILRAYGPVELTMLTDFLDRGERFQQDQAKRIRGLNSRVEAKREALIENSQENNV